MTAITQTDEEKNARFLKMFCENLLQLGYLFADHQGGAMGKFLQLRTNM